MKTRLYVKQLLLLFIFKSSSVHFLSTDPY